MSRKPHSSYTMGMILMGALLSVCLFAGCGPQQSGGPSNVPPIAKSAIGTPASQSVPTIPSLGSGNLCGTVTLGPNGTLLQAAAAKQVEDCFWRAYQQCKPASLALSVGGVDTVSVHTFSIEKQQSGCVISDVMESHIVPQPSGQNHIYACARLENTGTGLRAVSCGDEGTISIPNS